MVTRWNTYANIGGGVMERFFRLQKRGKAIVLVIMKRYVTGLCLQKTDLKVLPLFTAVFKFSEYNSSPTISLSAKRAKQL